VYTVQGGGSPTDRRLFGPGVRTETHASQPESLFAMPARSSEPRVGERQEYSFPAALPSPSAGGGRRGKNAQEPSREATSNRHEAGGGVGPRRLEKRLMGLDGHTHRRRGRRGYAMEHKAYAFDWTRFETDLRPLLGCRKPVFQAATSWRKSSIAVLLPPLALRARKEPSTEQHPQLLRPFDQIVGRVFGK